MPKATPAERLEVLARWRNEAIAAAHPVPSEQFIAEFAEVGHEHIADIRAAGDPVVLSWMPILEFFAKQWKMGVALPDPGSSLKTPLPLGTEVEQLVGMIETPAQSAAATAAPEPAASPADQRFAALKALRAKLGETAAESVAALKDSHLRTIARTDFVTEAEVASSLPNSLSGLAGAMAGVLAGLGGAAAPAAAAAPDAQSVSVPQARAPQVQAPTVEEAPAAVEEPVRPTGSTNDVNPAGFMPYNLIPADGAVGPITGSGTAETGIVMRWEAYSTPDPVVLYRVVSDDKVSPYSPDIADLVSSTAKLTATDTRPFASAVRYVQVWVNTGQSVDEAKATQPVLHAAGAFVAPPRSISIREDSGQVLANWEVWDKTTRVLVYRVPIERAAQESGATQHHIMQDDTNLGGFVDIGASRGATYLYQVVAEALIGGVGQRAAPVAVVVEVSEVIEAVQDLASEEHGGDDLLIDLTWTAPPGGQVVVYRTQTAPAPGSYLKPVAESGLTQAGLAEEDRLAYPITRTGTGGLMRNVPMPREWTRAYLTPVTLLNGQAFCGASVVVNNPTRVTVSRVVERVNMQLLNFAWPEGAASVFVYESLPGQPFESVQSGHAYEVTRERWLLDGGLRFPRPLATRGCELHLVPVMYYAGERIMGAPTTLSYDGIKRLSYDIRHNRKLMKFTGVTITLRAEDTVAKPPPFVLVHNYDRLPLSSRDGTVLTVVSDSVEGAPPEKRMTFPGGLGPAPSDSWSVPVETLRAELVNLNEPELRGFLRVLADIPPEVNRMLALVDPAPSGLRLGGAG